MQKPTQITMIPKTQFSKSTFGKGSNAHFRAIDVAKNVEFMNWKRQHMVCFDQSYRQKAHRVRSRISRSG